MKKAILSPLCSALVIPGLGQVINRHLKKGVIMLVVVFVLFAAFTVHIYRIISALIKSGAINTSDPVVIMDKIMVENPIGLWLPLVALCKLWAYSVIDAFWGGRTADKLDEGGLP